MALLEFSPEAHKEAFCTCSENLAKLAINAAKIVIPKYEIDITEHDLSNRFTALFIQ